MSENGLFEPVVSPEVFNHDLHPGQNAFFFEFSICLSRACLS
eukprot:COSAG06_NODE_7673_length_2418_cov_12.693834_1_plen_41_part_10